jgi:threonine dehydratase
VATLPVTPADIEAAARTIAGQVEKTPALASRTLSKRAGAEIYLKCENLQFTGSFKERGVVNRLSTMTAEEKKRGVITMSAGNHALALAYHGGRYGIPVTVLMPENAAFAKVIRTREFGATVIQEGQTLNDCIPRVREIQETSGAILVHPYDDKAIIAGQGTTGFEFLSQVPDLDTLVVPIGGGGLISGIAIAARSIKPKIEILGVETEAYPPLYNVLKKTDLPCHGNTIADGIAVKAPGGLTKEIVSALVDDVFLVSEGEIESAVVRLLESEKTVAEGAGGAALAAVLANRDRFKGKKVGVVISGGNIDMRLLTTVIVRELGREGRIMSITVGIDDKPGVLARVSSLVGEAGGNILEVSHNRMLAGAAKSADLGLAIEARDVAHAAEIRKCLEAAGFSVRE